MDPDPVAEEPSLSQALPDHVQRELNHSLHLYKHHHHGRVHRRDVATPAPPAPTPAPITARAVTEVIQTISVYQQVDVDTNGHTLGISLLTGSPDDTASAASVASAETTNESAASSDATGKSPMLCCGDA